MGSEARRWGSLRRSSALLGLAVLAVVGAAPGSAAAGSDSLYSGPGPRPGPEVLYRKPATAPQLLNAAPFVADPILVSGASAYRDGEFLYQDYLYDDHGAQGTARDTDDPRRGNILNGDGFSAPNGTYTYPRDEAYAFNAADLVELRVKPRANVTAFRITLNTLTDPDLVATSIAIGGADGGPLQQFPHGASASAPADYFLTVHGEEAELRPAAGGQPILPAPTATASLRRNQITVVVPHEAWDPGTQTVRLAAGVGLWDSKAGAYLIPGTSRTATEPGGAAGLAEPTAFFNVAFRFAEALPEIGDPASSLTDTAWWREREQGEALKTGDLTPFHAEVDFAKLESGEDDEMLDQPGGVPSSGPMNRILSTRFDTGEGTDFAEPCFRPGACTGQYVGQLQPYAIYVPDLPKPANGYGLTLLLHSLSANYNQFSGSTNQSQLAERGPGSIVITPEARGPNGWYYGHTAADAFEAWADVARNYPLAPGWTSIAGYSMGGYGTYKLATQFPDLFARANPVVGPPGLGTWTPGTPPIPGGSASNTNRMLASVRHVPFLIWAGTADQLVPVAGVEAQVATLDELGFRYTYDLFALDHLSLAANDEYAPAADFLGTHRVVRNPARVSYVVNPTMDSPGLGVVGDHAYWLSGLKLRRKSGPDPLGRVEATSGRLRTGDGAPEPTTETTGTLAGGNLGPLAYARSEKDWGPEPTTKRRNRLDLDLDNLKRLTVHVKRAKLGCRPRMRVESDGPVAVKLAGCGRTLRFR